MYGKCKACFVELIGVIRCQGESFMALNPDLLRGALEPVLLELIGGGASYGYEIARAVRSASGGQILAQEGTLYPALHRLEKRGYLRAKWGSSPEGRRRKHYQLTAEGRRYLKSSRTEWSQFSRSVSRILGTAHRGLAYA